MSKLLVKISYILSGDYTLLILFLTNIIYPKPDGKPVMANAEWILCPVRHPPYLLCLLSHLKARLLGVGGGSTVPLARGPRSLRETRGRCRNGMANSSNQLVS